MQLSGVDIDGNFMPFDMQPSQIAMNFNGMSSTLSGSVLTQQGQINLSGDADWSQLDNWRARIAAKGSKVRITVPPMVRLDVSPDVVFEATPSLFTLDGASTCRGRASWFTTCRKARSASQVMKLCSMKI
jgi:translocation and assembly module TamB